MYTEGEWKVNRDNRFRILSIVAGKMSITRQIGPHIGDYGLHSENIANANLIAAAPDMYEALKKLEPTITSIRDAEIVHPTMKAITVEALKALSKAEGK